MNDAKKMAGLLVMFILAVAFINRGSLSLSSTPTGASASAGFFGLVPNKS